MSISFPFKKESSVIFGTIHRPIVEVSIKHTSKNIWQPVSMIVDTGADYTLLPQFLASPLGVDLVKDCNAISTQGVGGISRVYLLKKNIRIKLGAYQRTIPMGFLSNGYIPPLLGRHGFFETFKVTFEKLTVMFE